MTMHLSLENILYHINRVLSLYESTGNVSMILRIEGRHGLHPVISPKYKFSTELTALDEMIALQCGQPEAKDDVDREETNSPILAFEGIS